MSDILIVDIAEIGRAVNVREDEFTPPFPGAKPALQQVWDTPSVYSAFEYLKKYKVVGTEISFLGRADIWIVLAFAYFLQPECTCYFTRPKRSEDDTSFNIPLLDLPKGELNPDVGFEYTLREEGDFLYMDYGVDTPGAKGHTFMSEQIPSLILPPIPEGKNLCLYSTGAYPVQWAVTNSYGGCSKSVFTSCHDDPFYHCAITNSSGFRYGDTVPRVIDPEKAGQMPGSPEGSPMH